MDSSLQMNGDRIPEPLFIDKTLESTTAGQVGETGPSRGGKNEPEQGGNAPDNTSSGQTGREGDYNARTRKARNPMGCRPWTHALNLYIRQRQDDPKVPWSD